LAWRNPASVLVIGTLLRTASCYLAGQLQPGDARNWRRHAAILRPFAAERPIPSIWCVASRSIGRAGTDRERRWQRHSRQLAATAVHATTIPQSIALRRCGMAKSAPGIWKNTTH